MHSIAYRLIPVVFALAAGLHAQNADFEKITIDHGLSQGMIYNLCQTRDGFLWVATKDGLNRYDGNNFRVFVSDPFDPYSLPENTATVLFEDSRGWLWVGLESKGLSLYDRDKERLHYIALGSNQKNGTSSFEIINIREMPDGSILLLRRNNNLLHFQIPVEWEQGLPAEADLSHFIQTTLFSSEQFSASENQGTLSLASLDVLDVNTVLVYSNKGPYRVDLKNKRVDLLDSTDFRQQYPNRDFWVPAQNRLFYFQNGVRKDPRYPPGFKISTIMMQPLPDHSYWIAVNEKLWHVPQGHIPDFAKPDWQMDAEISAITTDRNANIWIGTKGYGLRRINPKKQLFRKSASGQSIWGLWRDTRGRYYVKIANEVFPFDPKTGKIGALHAFPNGPTRILDMVPEPDGSCWLLGRGEVENGTAELRWYDAERRTFKSYRFPFDTTSSATGRQGPNEQWIKHYFYSRLLKTKDGCLWATGQNCHLARFSPQTESFDLLDYSSVFDTNASIVRAMALAEDGNGTIWIGTHQGLVRCQNIAGKFVFSLLAPHAKNTGGINNNSIACLLPDPDNPAAVLWIGTKGGGINRMDLRTGLVRHITTREGLPDNVIYGILPGNSGELWCSTNRGLVRLKPAENSDSYDIISFKATQGLQDNEFNTQAFFKDDNGELLFGGVSGFNRFFPQDVLPDTLPPPVYVVGLNINHDVTGFGKPGSPLGKPLEYLQTLELSHDQNNLSFEFAVLDFTDPSRNRYRYRLVGADPVWVETGTSRFAHFTHLSPGRYTLLVQGNNGEGAWHDAAHPIAITIRPPWWRSTLAYIVYATLILLGGWQAYRFQLRRIKLREQLAYEHRETERVKELEQMKTDFFSNVTHEIRTPLTLIIEPLRQLLREPDHPGRMETIRLAESNSRKLLGLVNQLLDLAKLESGQMTFDLRRGNFEYTLRQVFESFLPLAEKRGIKLTLRVVDPLPEFVFDTGKVELVLNNLLSNALKFTLAEGGVHIECRHLQAPETGQESVHVVVRDTGIGIPTEALDKIFDRFYQADNSHTRYGDGTGIGLALSKELALRMGGSIEVESALSQGSVFTFRLPVYADAPTSKERSSAHIPTNSWSEKAESFEPQMPVPKSADLPAQPVETDLPLVLIVEDNADMRGFIRRSLGLKWKIAEASDGEEGVKKAVELLPDLVVSDLMMPRKDGLTVCDELKNNELTAHIPIILLTAKSKSDTRISGLKRGADDYLTKPFNTEELLARMENLVENRRRLRTLFAQTRRLPADGSIDTTLPDFLSEHDQEFLQKVNRQLEQNLQNEHFGVDDLASLLHISRSQLHRKLKALTDRAATDLIRDYRLDRAYSMLQNREGRVAEIAQRAGFVNEKHFSTVFRERFGMPPSHLSGKRNQG